MELDELAGRLDRLEKAHAASRLVIAELTRLLVVMTVLEEEDVEHIVVRVGRHMMGDTDEAVAEMRELVAKQVAKACSGESQWRLVLDRAMEEGGDEDPAAAMVPPSLR